MVRDSFALALKVNNIMQDLHCAYIIILLWTNGLVGGHLNFLAYIKKLVNWYILSIPWLGERYFQLRVGVGKEGER